MVDKEKKTSKYMTDSNGDYILNKDGSRRKKPGRPKNKELSSIQLALRAKKQLDKKNKKVKKLTRSLAKVTKEVKQEEKVLTSNVLTESELSFVSSETITANFATLSFTTVCR